MGTPAFATGILKAIVENNQHDVVGVITVADKPAGRGQKVLESDVKQYALTEGLTILQPTNLKNEQFIRELKALTADVFVVVAFRMLPKVVWEMPQYGTFNLHASLLPQYRGAAPINWAIINGETKTGVTTFFIDDKIDTGEIILSKETDILPDEHVGSLHDRLMHLGQSAVIESLALIVSNEIKTIKQDNQKDLKTAYKLNADNCKIDWHVEPTKIINLVRGLNPYPGAWTTFKNEKEHFRVKVFEVEFIPFIHEIQNLLIEITDENIFIYVKNGKISLKDLQFPNKKRMKIKEFLNGWRSNTVFFSE